MKKVLSLLIVLTMIVSALPVIVSASHWADEDVAYLIEQGAIAENDAMLETLDTPITRSQMVKVIVALLDGEEPIEGKEYFTDITAEDTHIAKAAANGFVNGFGDGTFRPNNPITRQDFFTIVGRAYKLEGKATKEFTDNDSIADYAKPYVDALQSIGIVNGYGDGTVNPRGNITIAETLAVMHRTDEYVKANTPEEPPQEEEKPKPKPSGGSSGGGGRGSGGGGSSGGGSFGGDNTPPEISYTLSTTEECDGALTITVDVTDSSNVEAGWFLRHEYHELPQWPNMEEQVKVAYLRKGLSIEYNDIVGNNNYYDSRCGGTGAYCILLNYNRSLDNLHPIENNSFTVTQNGVYFIYAKDGSGNLTVVRVDIDNIKVPSAIFDIEYEEDVAGEIVAYATANISTNKDAPVKEMFMIRGDDFVNLYPTLLGTGVPPYWKRHKYFYNDARWAVMDSDEYIAETDGKFALPDFGPYALYMLDENGNWGVSEFEISPPESEDTTPPTFTAAVSDGNIITINPTDNVAVGSVRYVNSTFGSYTSNYESMYKLNVHNRQTVVGNTFTVEESGDYYLCVTDTSGNSTYARMFVSGRTGEITFEGIEDGNPPTLSCRALPKDEKNNWVKIAVQDRYDEGGISMLGYFYSAEPCELGIEGEVTAAYILKGQKIDLSKDISEIAHLDDEHGGLGSVCILKNYWEATEGAGLKPTDMKVVADGRVVALRNGSYFIFAIDQSGNLSVVRIDIDNIN